MYRQHQSDVRAGSALQGDRACRWRITIALDLSRPKRATRQSILGMLLLLASTSAAAQSYEIVRLETLGCGGDPVAVDMNNRLQVVGYSCLGVTVWGPGGRIQSALRGYDFLRSRISAINNEGVIALQSGSGVRTIGYSASLIRQDGTAIFWSSDASGFSRLFLTDTGIFARSVWTGDWNTAWYGGATFTLGPGLVSGVSDSGVIAGFTSTLYGPRVPFLRWPDGSEVRPWPEAQGVDALGPAGHFAGINIDTNGAPSLLYGTPDLIVSRSRLPLGITISCGGNVTSINRNGDLVGIVRPTCGRTIAFAFHNGAFYDLNALAGLPDDAINEIPKIVDNGAVLVRTYGEYVVLVPARPAVPSGASATVVGRTVTLRWGAVAGAADYLLEAGSATGASDLFNGPVGPQPTLTATVPAGRYFVRLRARNAAGVSAASAELLIDVP
jgi:hypothetical protein